MVGVRVPLYRVDGFWIDAYLIKYVEFKYNRVLMIREVADDVRPHLDPIPYDELVSLVIEGYNDLLSLIGEVSSRVETRRSIRILEVVALPAYNPSQYLARRENEAVILPLLNMLRKLYEALIEKLRSSNYSGVGSVEVSLRGDRVFINGKFDRVYTSFYENDDGFRAKLNEILGVEPR